MDKRTQMMRSNNAGVSRNEVLYSALRTIFAANDGAWYDFQIPFIYTTSTGVTAVAAAENPIGLLIDRRLGAGLGPELVTNGGFYSADSWSAPVAGASITGGVLAFDGVTSITNGATITTNTPVTPIVAGKAYEVSYTIPSATTAGVSVNVGGTLGTIRFNAASYREIIIATNTTAPLAMARGSTGVRTGSIDNISVKLLDGNHAIQATAAARPTYRIDAGGRQYAAFLGTDDSLTSATGGGGSAGFFFCAAIRPTGGAGTTRNIFSDYSGANGGYTVRLGATNKLTIAAGNGTGETALASTASVSVGTDYVLTAWDDGTNLNVQINNGVIESVARPVVVAGTAGLTLGKFNGAAIQFLIADAYHMAYAKNTGLTAAQRESIKQYAAKSIGIAL